MAARPDHRAAIEPELRSCCVLPALVEPQTRRRTPERDKVVVAFDDSGPVFELAGRHRAITDRDRLNLPPYLPLRAVQHDFEVVAPVDQADLELVASVRAVALEREQLPVAV